MATYNVQKVAISVSDLNGEMLELNKVSDQILGILTRVNATLESQGNNQRMVIGVLNNLINLEIDLINVDDNYTSEEQSNIISHYTNLNKKLTELVNPNADLQTNQTENTSFTGIGKKLGGEALTSRLLNLTKNEENF